MYDKDGSMESWLLPTYQLNIFCTPHIFFMDITYIYQGSSKEQTAQNTYWDILKIITE